MKKLFIIFGLILLSINLRTAFSQGSWNPLISPTTHPLKKICFVDSLTGWAAGDSGIIINTTNGGLNWIVQGSNVESNIIDIHFFDKNFGWAVTWYYVEGVPFGTLLLTTTNGGNDWSTITYSEEGIFLFSVFVMDSTTVWFGGNNGVIVKTTNGGRNWIYAKQSPSQYANFPILNLSFYDSRKGFANGGLRDVAGVIWRTQSFGDDWLAVPVGPEPITELFIFDSLNVLGVGGDMEFGSGIAWTNDGGDSWNYQSLEIFGVTTAVSFRTRREGWATIAIERKLLYTNDSGKTWQAFETPDSSAIFDLTFPDSLHGYAIGLDGVIYKFEPSITNSLDDYQNQPSNNFELYQNYPNPFNSITTIKFKIPNPGRVTLKVFDLLGKEISTLVDELKPAGEYGVSFDLRKLMNSFASSGIYFYELKYDNFRQTKKMTWLK